ncbi:MAG: hypothetical protein HYX37_01705 [Rhizobiales bacterium]|nr:hypothetical protein [Hyphomicrobiales bacterium]
MIESSNRIFSYAEIEAMTLGWADKRMIQNRRALKLWLTPVAEPPKGKAYDYRWPHVFEMVISAELVKRGFTHESATEAIRNRLRAASGRRGGWAADLKFSELPEIDGRDCYWVMNVMPDQHWGLVPGAVLACWSQQEVGAAIADLDAALVLNVARVLREARARLPAGE